jgi:hypothetical protein
MALVTRLHDAKVQLGPKAEDPLRRRPFRRMLAATALVAVALLSAARAAGVPEYELKAAFLYNFAKFVEWPEETFAADDPIVVCVVGEDPFGGALERSLAGKTVRDRAIVLRRVATAADVRHCHIAFVNVDAHDLPAMLRSLDDQPVLTVGDAEGFAERGGMIGFVTEDQKLRFEVNLDAAERVKLRVSSQMLKLATRVLKSE